MPEELHTPGWDAITAACRDRYGEVEPVHWGVAVPWFLGGPDPLPGVSAYDAGEAWHYVSYGLTELYEKESEDAATSGYGFELSFLLRKTSDEPPTWPVSLFQNLARYVFQTGNVLQDGDYMPFNGPIAAEEVTELVGGLFVADPDLVSQRTENGDMAFRRLIAVTEGELRAAQQWNTQGVAGLLGERGAFVADLARGCFSADPAFSAALHAGASEEGSRTGLSYVGESLATEALGGGQWELVLGALAVQNVRSILPYRVPFDRPYTLVSSSQRVQFRLGEEAACRDELQGLAVVLTAHQARELARILRPERGAYGVDGLPLIVVVEPTEIRDASGNVVQVIG